MENKSYALLLKLSSDISKNIFNQQELENLLEKEFPLIDCIYCEELDKAHPTVIRQLMSDCQEATHYILTCGQLCDNEISCCSNITNKILKELTSSPSGVESGENYNLYMLPNQQL